MEVRFHHHRRYRSPDEGVDLLTYLQFQALFLWLVLAAGWAWAGANRRRERLRRLQQQQHPQHGPQPKARPAKGQSTPTTPPSPPNAACNGALQQAGRKAAGPGRNAASGPARLLPPVSVVMPVKGCRPHSTDNWESQLALEYDGPLEFVFVVESADDPALPVLRSISAARQGTQHPQHAPPPPAQQATAPQERTQQQEGECQDGTAALARAGAGAALPGRPGGAVAVRTVVAGLASSCSQKAHNLCAGIEACDPRVTSGRAPSGPSGYVLCLDDDVCLHPGTLRDMVAELEAEPGVFMATGYPFDVPPPGSSLPAYLALSYHLPLLIAFSVARDTAFVWGGCMLLRRRELTPGDPRGLLAAWRRGGYSDDLILASLCSQQRLRIRVPPYAIFPQRLDPGMTWRGWLNYLHRQLFVLDTYTNEHNRQTNHTMMVLHSLLSWGLVLPSLAGFATLARKLLLWALAAAAAALELALRFAGWGAATETASAAASAAGPGAALGGAAASVATWAGAAAAAARAAPLPAAALAVAAGWLAAHAALVFMTAEVLALFRLLSPGRPAAPLAWFRWGRLWAALLGANTLLPPLMLYTFMCPQVEWGGVQYRKHRGKVTPLRRRAGPEAVCSDSSACVLSTAPNAGTDKAGAVPMEAAAAAGSRPGGVAFRAAVVASAAPVAGRGRGA